MMIKYVNAHADSTQESGMSSKTPLKTLQRHQGELLVLTKRRAYQTLGQILKILPTLSAQKQHSAGGKGGPKLFLRCGILILLLHRALCKVSEPEDNSLTLCPPLCTFCAHIFGTRSKQNIISIFFLYQNPIFENTNQNSYT